MTDDSTATGKTTGADDSSGVASGAATPGVEVELKFRIDDPAAAERVLAADQLAELSGVGARAKTVQIEDRYVDTADGALARAGFAVRLRQRGAATIVSVKSLQHTETASGASRRLELEGPADRVAPPVDWPASDARSLVLEHAGDAPFVERVTVRQLRHKRVFRSGPTRVELSLDEVDVVHRGRIVSSFVELEAELMSGDEAVLEGVATTLRAETGATPSSQSKLAAALSALAMAGRSAMDDDDVDVADAVESVPPSLGSRQAVQGAEVGRAGRSAHDATVDATAEPARLVAGRTPGVTADDHVAEAGRKVLRFHLARMLDYEAGTRSGADPEDLHKMRVATRRQRAAWRVFGSSFREGRTKRYRRDLRDIAGRLGAVRDLDVQLEAADAYRADLPTTEQRGLEPLLGAWRTIATRPGACCCASSIRTATAASSTTIATSSGPRVRSCWRGARSTRTTSATPRRRASGRRMKASARTSPSCAGPTSRRCTSCGSPGSGCATRSSSCARRSALTRRRSSRRSSRSRITSGS